MDKLIVPRPQEKTKNPKHYQIARNESIIHTDAPIEQRSDLLDWYLATFILDPERGYALMNPVGHKDKYSRRSQPLTSEMICGALNGEMRRLPIDGKWQSTPYSYANVPKTRDNKAKNIIFDIDQGGRIALLKLLTACHNYGLWAFAQLGESDKHNGGYVYVLGKEWQPASMLQAIGNRLALTAGMACEVWPCDNDLRLPLMTHLRAPGGPHRFPLIFPDGEIVEVRPDPWAALATLRAKVSFTETAQWTALLDKLPSLPEGGGDRTPLHRSKVVVGKVDSVVGWFLDNFDLYGQLEEAGAKFNRKSAHVICCPFHDDEHPSLTIWDIGQKDKKEKKVCKCFSAQSNCPLSKVSTGKGYFDAFDIYSLRNKLSASEAVKKLVEDNNLGKKREFEIVTVTSPDPTPIPDAMEIHEKAITQARGDLLAALIDGTGRRDEVTVVRATPGLGKTTMAADLANRLQAEGKTVAICAPTLEVAESEWLPRLKNGFVMRSKIDKCTCFDEKYLTFCLRFGYQLPRCTNPNCPYARQAQEAFGKIVIFQHAHLTFLNLAEVNVLIVDESPLGTLLSEKHVSPGTLDGFLKRHPTDPAIPLLAALRSTINDLPETIFDVRGPALREKIEAHLNGKPLIDAVNMARRSPLNIDQPAPPDDVTKMAPQFLSGLLDAVMTESFAVGRSGASGQQCYLWVKRETLGGMTANALLKPSVLVLDGSAVDLVSQALYYPWSVRSLAIEAPLSPLVEVIQVTATSSTRHIVKDEARMQSLARNVALVCNEIGVKLDGGISYQGALPTLQSALGGDWLHYGGQRGHNELANAQALAVVCSPTVPPTALERKALALWPDVATIWEKGEATGAYVAADFRLQAINQLHAMEELRQAIFRARPLTAEKPVKLLVFTPWHLSNIGIKADRLVSALPHGLSDQSAQALDRYHGRAKASMADSDPGPSVATNISNSARNSPNSECNNIYESTPHSENGQNIAQIGNSPPLPATVEVSAPFPPSPTDLEATERRARAAAKAQAAISESVRRHGR